MTTQRESAAGRLAVRGVRRARRAARSLYYARGYGRRFPLHRTVAERVRTWELADGRGDVPLDKAQWDQKYADHGWDFLSGLAELAHYAVITAYGAFLRPGASVLDLGCGAGVLHERYRPHGYQRYVGVDISEVAISGLATQGFPLAEFVVHDAETYAPTGTFDVIIFNESITYFADPEEGFDRYVRWLAADGIMIVSCHIQSDRAQAILRILKSRHEVIDETVVAQGAASWRIVVLRPSNR